MIVEARTGTAVPLSAATSRLLELLGRPAAAALALSATGEGEAVLLRTGAAGMSKQVSVHTLEPTYGPERVSIPIRWVATGVTGELFPSLDGNLELRATADGGTEIALVGSYRPPFGRAGEVLDQLLMRRVARGTVQSFVGMLARAVAGPEPDWLARLEPLPET